MNDLAMSLRQSRFELRSFFRNRSGMIFTLAFPLMFLFIFGLSADGHTTTFKGHQVPLIQFFVPGIIAYGIIGATYTSLAMRLTTARDQGILKRVAGTPLPRSNFVAGQILASVTLGALIALITLVAARVIYDVQIYAHTAAAALITVAVGSAAFSAMGIALASIIPNSDSAPGITQGTLFPILFISDVFYSVDDGPRWLGDIASVFPIKHLANALQVTFDPSTTGAGFSPAHLAVVAVWGIVAGLFASQKFRWEAKKS